MSNETRTFRSQRDTRPPTPFELVFEVQEERESDEAGGGLVPTGQWVEETRTFHALHKIPSGLVMAVQDGGDPGDPQAGTRQARAIRTLLQTAVLESKEFLAILDDPRLVVDPGMLNQIIDWIVGNAADRPTNTP